MYIVFEGVDGSGKTTMWNKVAKWLKEKGKGAVGTYEPQESFNGYLDYAWGKSLDEISNPSASSALYYALERLILQQEIKESLEEGQVVLSDRSYISSMVYQYDIDFVKEVNQYALKPDLVIFLDVDAEVAYERLKERDGRVDVSLRDLKEYVDRYEESIDWVCDPLNGLDKPVFTVDANKSQDEVFRTIIQFLEKYYDEELHLNFEYEPSTVDVAGMHKAVRGMRGLNNVMGSVKNLGDILDVSVDILTLMECIEKVEKISEKYQDLDDE